MTPFRRRSAAAFLAAGCVCLLSACLESYEEDMVIHADLSGSAVVRIKLPDALLSKFDPVREEFAPANIEKRFKSLSGVSLKRYTITEGRYPEATFEVSFSSLEKLAAAAAANKPAQMLVGEFVVKEDEDGRTVIERRLGGGSATMALPSDKFALFKTHFQRPVELSNSDSGFKDSAHNDVRYRWSLAEIAAQKPSMLNKLVKPLPWLWILGGVAALVALAWVGWKVFGQKEVARPADPPPAAKEPGAKPVALRPEPSDPGKPPPGLGS